MLEYREGELKTSIKQESIFPKLPENEMLLRLNCMKCLREKTSIARKRAIWGI